MTLEVIEVYSRIEARQDAVFYQGHGKVAQVECDGFSVDIYCDGDMRAIYECPSEVVLRTPKDFIDHGLDTDEKLTRAVDEGTLVWDMNPWFDCYTSDGEHIDIVTHTIKDAIVTALVYVQDERASELMMLQDF
jgi:hypothetical protein